MIHAGQTVTVVASDGFRLVIGGKTVTVVPGTTTSEIHRYRAYATQMPPVGTPRGGW
jgi:hypothetical protein